MRQDLCDITLVLDKSESMRRLTAETISGVNKFIDEQKRAPGFAMFTLVQFNTNYEFTHRAKDIQNVHKLTPDTYRPDGNTALRDAMGRAILETGVRLKNLPEHERPARVLFVVLTDGEENSSVEVSQESLKRMVEEQTHIWKWQFMYLGANVDAFEQAAQLGIQPQFAAAYGHNARGFAAAMDIASYNVGQTRSAALVGDDSVSLSYSISQREELQNTVEEK